MKIMLAAYNLAQKHGGVQTWSQTMKKAFSKMGHDVSFWDLESGEPALSDLAICAQNTTLKKLNSYGIFPIHVVHGVNPPEEKPVSGAKKYYAVSEETQDYIKSEGFSCSGIFRNPIDVDRFKNVGCGIKCKRIVINNYAKQFPYTKQLEKYYDVFDMHGKIVSNVENHIEHADVVIASGRSAYEAMSMGKNVIICGPGNPQLNMAFDGMVTEFNFYKLREKNCSGRYYNLPLTEDSILDELSKYDRCNGEVNAFIIRKNNHYMEIAKQFIKEV